MSEPRREIKLNAQERKTAYDWHGGMGSMLYAAASTGALRLGQSVSGMTKAEQWWDITDRLMREARSAAQEARQQNLGPDHKALLSISRKAARAARVAQKEVHGGTTKQTRSSRGASKFEISLAQTEAVRMDVPTDMRPLFDHLITLAKSSHQHGYAQRAGRELAQARKLAKLAS